MDCKDLIVDGLNRVEESMKMALDGLTEDQLAFRPVEHANSVAWLAWHLTRVQDDHVSELAGRPQAWTQDHWHERFNRPGDLDDTGFGHTPQQVASLRPEGPGVLLDYFGVVHLRSMEYVQGLTCADMDRVIDRRWDPPVTVGVRLVSVVNDCTQHVGQMSYIRGLIEGRRWLPY